MTLCKLKACNAGIDTHKYCEVFAMIKLVNTCFASQSNTVVIVVVCCYEENIKALFS